MEVVLENKMCRAKIKTLGGELISFCLKKDNSEYIWQGNKEIWEGQAPVLFPLIGRLKDGMYEYENEKFKMPIHGFAKTSQFQIKEYRKDYVNLVLDSNTNLLNIYPFEFSIEISYQLQNNELIKKHSIYNRSSKIMYYEIGGHEGYNLCLEENETMKDYYLQFKNTESIFSLNLDDKTLISNSQYEIKLDNDMLPLKMDLFKNDAIILHGKQCENPIIKSTKSSRSIEVNCKGFNTVAFWTPYYKQNTNFLCIEPWSSLPDCNYVDNKLKNKVDICTINPKCMDIKEYRIKIS